MSGYSHKGAIIETEDDLANPGNCSNWNNSSKRIVATILSLSEVVHVLSVALAAKFQRQYWISKYTIVFVIKGGRYCAESR